MLHDSCMFCTGLGRSVPYALGVSYRITDARRGFASVKLMVDLGPCARLTSFVGLWVEGLRSCAGGLSCVSYRLSGPGTGELVTCRVVRVAASGDHACAGAGPAGPAGWVVAFADGALPGVYPWLIRGAACRAPALKQVGRGES